MYRGYKVGISIPAYNEETQIGKVIETMPDFVDLMVVVNDNSSDRTGEIAQQYVLTNPKVILVNNHVNLGVGGAACNGYKKSVEMGMDVVAVMAGDAQMHPDDLPNVLDPIIDGKADYTKGNRLNDPDVWRVMPKYRYVGNHILSFMTKLSSGYWHVNDSQAGYTAITRQTLEDLDLERVASGYVFENSLLVELNILNKRVVNVPIKPVYDIGEKSDIKLFKVSFELLLFLVGSLFSRIWRKYIRHNVQGNNIS